MPTPDLTELLERGAVRPRTAGDLDAVWRRGQARRRRKRAAITGGTALAIIGVVAVAGTLWPRPPAPFIEQTPDASDPWGPLAVVPGSPGGGEALIHGTLKITDQCVLLDEQGDDVVLVWPADATVWNPDQRTITYTNRDGATVELRDGMQVSFGGGGDSTAEGGDPPEAWANRIDWVAPPAPDCLSDTRWWVNDVVAAPSPATTPTDTAAPPAQTRVRTTTDGAPPFYIDLGAVQPASGDVWATHTLTVVSEWRTPIGIRLDDTTLQLQQRRPQSQADRPDGGVRVLAPGDDTTITISVIPGSNPPEPGIHTATLQIPFWRDVDPDQPPSGAPDGTATIDLTYEILTDAQLEALGPFCDQAPAAVDQATSTWLQDPGPKGIQALLDALAATEQAAAALTDPRADLLREEIDILQDKLERLRDGEQVGHGQHEGFTTHDVVSIINELCDTQINSTGIQA